MTTPGASAPSTVTAEDFDRVLGTRALQPVFQPLIDLDDRHVVGYEALARGPVGLGPGDAGGPVRDGLAGDPARLLATVAQARQAGFGVALDDVGAAPATLAVLPFVRPDLIKLDMRLLQGRTTTEVGHIINTVRAQAERTDAVVIAEGIETIKHAREAAAAGATIGQGFLFGYPAHLPSPLPRPGRPSPSRPRPAPPPRPPGRWWRRPGSRAGPPRTCWWRPACSWSTRSWTPTTRCAASGTWS